ncbi:MAG: hypothetical protein ACD_80C00040G0005 [uncultured bacterium (gcode 4)]|uniref:Uncharacterized protein n=1 Tax=uncultured bacterium (gcode 4) TaxID=1234023 RepID=K1XYV7_9BACT|nr:MAG: hypothetical protein ACD_80C00040G0005 [uncultured bacterium (gcode 4)]HBB04594.1 hypothetical protein [Candidatus Gracilibacteria bacterium]
MTTKISSKNVLQAYGVSSRIIELINRKNNILFKDLNWLEVGYLYMYAKHLRKELQPWINKIQKHFSQNDYESMIIFGLARNHEELKGLLVNEITCIKSVLPLHEFHTAIQILPKLNEENKNLTMDWIKDLSMKQKSEDSKIYCLLAYRDLCPSQEEKEEIVDMIIDVINKATVAIQDHELKKLYKKIPDERIATLWLNTMKDSKYFRDWVDAAVVSGRDEFFEKAKNAQIVGVTSDICRMMGEHYTESKDPRILDLWVHVIEHFHAKKESNIIGYCIEAYQATKDQRFFTFAKANTSYFDQVKKLYELQPDDDLLESLKKLCGYFKQAVEGLILTGNMYFLLEAQKYIREQWEYAIQHSLELYNELNTDPKKYKKQLNYFKGFVEGNMMTMWTASKSTHDREKLFKLLAS